ncbi:carboxypeptidase-like regulatory domain-containing protein [Dysgonomonas sp. 25]|uniref:carboxypeptidase-like regulatory domain-containing protein n=1 Tax=Dysgonomonas sp. 25 TaxID=2302933 RepID=UPI0013D0563E|nr:carboxypeptidase-like regulatory domain-containing protein [Dysgonomonas sp. 25]NDV67389.1 hypothetical protein [Dysgonomonas sp. 25]
MKIKTYHILFRFFSFLSDKTNGAPFVVKYKLLLGTLILGLVASAGCKSSKKEAVDPNVIPHKPITDVTCYIIAIEPLEGENSDTLTIRGNIKDNLNQPIPGARISIKDKPNDIATADINGNFSLQVNRNDSLVFSYPGFVSKEIAITEIQNKPIILEEEPFEDSVVNIHPRVTCYKITVSPSIAEEIEVKGQVVDERSEPIAYLSISIKGGTTGVLTDVDGKFVLKAKRNDILIFSYVGFETQEIRTPNIIGSSKPIVMMEKEMILCYDVVIVPSTPYQPKKITKFAYNEVQIAPASPEGDLDRFRAWMESNIQYNERMLKDKVEGEVILSFAIDKKGKIVNKKVLTKLSPDADKEALRVLSTSGKWEPGMHNSEAVKTVITLAVEFKLP